LISNHESARLPAWPGVFINIEREIIAMSNRSAAPFWPAAPSCQPANILKTYRQGAGVGHACPATQDPPGQQIFDNLPFVQTAKAGLLDRRDVFGREAFRLVFRLVAVPAVGSLG
jgi:hypothetical protein